MSTLKLKTSVKSISKVSLQSMWNILNAPFQRNHINSSIYGIPNACWKTVRLSVGICTLIIYELNKNDIRKNSQRFTLMKWWRFKPILALAKLSWSKNGFQSRDPPRIIRVIFGRGQKFRMPGSIVIILWYFSFQSSGRQQKDAPWIRWRRPLLPNYFICSWVSW